MIRNDTEALNALLKHFMKSHGFEWMYREGVSLKDVDSDLYLYLLLDRGSEGRVLRSERVDYGTKSMVNIPVPTVGNIYVSIHTGKAAYQYMISWQLTPAQDLVNYNVTRLFSLDAETVHNRPEVMVTLKGKDNVQLTIIREYSTYSVALTDVNIARTTTYKVV